MSGLWHYTCDHGHAAIEASGSTVIPALWQTDRAAGTPGVYAWFTDLAVPQRDALGLTSHLLECDRTAHRYAVTDPAHVVRWLDVRRRWIWAEELESAPGARPRHWFVSDEAVPVKYSPNGFREEHEAAKRRNAMIPPHARMIVTNPALSAHTRRESP